MDNTVTTQCLIFLYNFTSPNLIMQVLFKFVAGWKKLIVNVKDITSLTNDKWRNFKTSEKLLKSCNVLQSGRSENFTKLSVCM